MKTLMVSLVVLASVSATHAQVYCPGVPSGRYPDYPGASFVPACALEQPTQCPTLAECSAGWQYRRPAAPVFGLPIAWEPQDRNEVSLRQCSFSGAGLDACEGSFPPGYSITLREWCGRVKALPVPPGRSIPDPLWLVGVCGAALVVPLRIQETAAQAPTWKIIGPGRAARLRELELWLRAEAREEGLDSLGFSSLR